MVKNQIKPMNLIGQFREFADRVEKEAAAALMEDIGYGEVPVEFKGVKNNCVVCVVSLPPPSLSLSLSLSLLPAMQTH